MRTQATVWVSHDFLYCTFRKGDLDQAFFFLKEKEWSPGIYSSLLCLLI